MQNTTQADYQKRITNARITPLPQQLFDPMPDVIVTLEGENEEKKLFSYYPDEISFDAGEFIGLRVEEAHALFHKKDVAYLRS